MSWQNNPCYVELARIKAKINEIVRFINYYPGELSDNLREAFVRELGQDQQNLLTQACQDYQPFVTEQLNNTQPGYTIESTLQEMQEIARTLTNRPTDKDALAVLARFYDFDLSQSLEDLFKPDDDIY